MQRTALEYKEYYDSQQFLRDCIDIREEWGAIYTPRQTLFRVWATLADRVSVCLYHSGFDVESGTDFIKEVPMTVGTKPGTLATYECVVSGDLDGVYYTYKIERDGEVLECQDPYGKACGANGKRSMVVDLRSTDPVGWQGREDCTVKENTVICELHVKDFSYHKSSGVSEKNRGKYLAFTEESQALTHLKRLGISHVQLLPIFDFGSVEETDSQEKTFNWGYDPLNFNVPEGSYATDCYDGKVRIREVKQMIQVLHREGIGVVMDVVYNHTYRTEGPFQTLAPYYYYRQNADGSFSNGSACGNETASERQMCSQFICHSVKYWAEEYGLDGFRFDLMGLHDTEIMNLIRKEMYALSGGENILVYGEPWRGGATAMAEGSYPADKGNLHRLVPGIAAFNDDIRDAIKGSVFQADAPGFVNGAEGMEEQIGNAYLCNLMSEQDPRRSITYVSVHDNYTLWDKLVMTGRNDQNFLVRDQKLIDWNKLAAGIVFTCLGTPLFQAGEEFARTKHGDENSYCSSPEVNCLDWDRKEEFSDLTDYYRGLIALRGEIGLYMRQTSQSPCRVEVCKAKDGLVVVRMDNRNTGKSERWQELFIVCNSRSRSAKEKLPEGKWEKLVDKSSSWHWKKQSIWSRMKKAGGSVRIAGSAIVIYGRKEG